MSVAVCAHCGRLTEEHNRHLRFVLPEPVLAVPVEERAARTWGNEVLMMVEEVGAFVRVLVPAELKLDGMLANMLPPWEEQTYRHPLRVAVRNPEEVPYAVESTEADLQRILTDEWSHDFVLAAVAPFE